jgi:hypothetical protein
MSRQDHCFLLELPRNGVGMAFCRSDGIGLERARNEVARVLADVKGLPGVRAPYLGRLDYRDMDEEIGQLLHLFEKHDPVWLLLFAAGRETR